MNKNDLINEVANLIGSKKNAGDAVNCVFDTIGRTLREKESVTLVGFGTFKTVKRKGRTGRNPQNGEPVDIPAKTIPKFVPGKALKEAVN
jgi:DNA-binding protein HU-beta